MSDLQSYPQLLSLMQQRFSCRSYDLGRGCDRDLIGAVIDAARIAPSACNRQPWQFLVVDSPEARDIIAMAYSRDWIKTAPAYIIALGDHDQAWHRADDKDHTDVDVAIAVEHICLAATALGMATCWVCNFDEHILRDGFKIPAHLEPVAIIPIGYAAPDCPVPNRNRKPTDEILKWGEL